MRANRAMLSRTRGFAVTAVLGASLLTSAGASAQFQGLPTAPGTAGDQLLFFFDVRQDRATFLNVGNTDAQNSVTLEVVYYTQTFDTRLSESVIVVPGGGAIIIDPSTVAGVAGNGGLATITPIVSEQDHTPVVPRRPLQGSFTIANLPANAAFGDNAFGRLALVGPPGGGSAPRGAPGAAVDGVGVSYQSIQPPTTVAGGLTLPVYINPSTLDPPENDGNRVLIAAFADEYAAPVGPGNAPRFNLVATTNNTQVNFFNASNGQRIVTDRAASTTGVEFESLQALSGNFAFTQGGRVEFTVAPFNGPTESFFGIFSQSLAAFAGSQRLTPIDIR